MNKKTVGVFIGRFQIFHNGHMETLRKAIKKYDKVVLVFGSANLKRTHKNPFSAFERWKMVSLNLTKEERQKVLWCAVNDMPGEDKAWAESVVAKVTNTVNLEAQLADKRSTYSFEYYLTGYDKDETSFYLKLFPQWENDVIPRGENNQVASATTVREIYFKNAPMEEIAGLVPGGTLVYLDLFRTTEDFGFLTLGE